MTTSAAPAQLQSRVERPFLTAEWRYLAMLNFAVDPQILQPFVPRGTELDFFEGRTFVSLVGFMFLDTRLRGLPIPFHRQFEELNLRFYVRREAGDEIRRGVCFIKEIVPRWAVAKVARWAYNENYQSLPMRNEITGFDEANATTQTRAMYQWRFRRRWNRLSLTATGPSHELVAGTQEEYIAEHYWGYSVRRDGGTLEYRVNHPSWRVWPAAAEFDCDVAGLYGDTFVDCLNREPVSAFLADGSPVEVLKPAIV